MGRTRPPREGLRGHRHDDVARPHGFLAERIHLPSIVAPPQPLAARPSRMAAAESPAPITITSCVRMCRVYERVIDGERRDLVAGVCVSPPTAGP
jgi:hypothetical protein